MESRLELICKEQTANKVCQYEESLINCTYYDRALNKCKYNFGNPQPAIIINTPYFLLKQNS